MTSVCCRLPPTSARWKRIAIPCGLAFESVSGICGSPVEEEKRTVIGTDEVLKCDALLTFDAKLVGVNVPVKM